MSDNPFLNQGNESGSMEQPSHSQSIPKPSWLTFVLIMSLIIGLLGLIGNVFVVISPFFSEWIQSLTPKPEQTEEQMEAARQLNELQMEGYIPSLLFAILNFIVAPLLVIGALGGLARKPWTTKVLKIGFIMAIVLNVLRTTYSLITQISDKDKIQELTLKTLPREQVQLVESAMGITFIATLVMIVFFALVLIAFYVYGLKKITSSNVKCYLGVKV